MLLNKIWLYIGLVLAGIAAYFGWRTKIRSDAIDDERKKQQQEVLNAANERNKINQRVDSADDAKLDEWLQPPKR